MVSCLSMPSAPKKTSSSKKTLSPEEHTLLLKTRREAIEQRLLRLQAKIDKDMALLKKYTPPEETESCGCACGDEKETESRGCDEK